MPTKEELTESLVKMVSKMEDPKIKQRFADFNKTLQLNFTDDEDAICHIILVHASEGNALLRSLEAQIIHRADFIYYGGLRSHMGIK